MGCGNESAIVLRVWVWISKCRESDVETYGRLQVVMRRTDWTIRRNWTVWSAIFLLSADIHPYIISSFSTIIVPAYLPVLLFISSNSAMQRPCQAVTVSAHVTRIYMSLPLFLSRRSRHRYSWTYSCYSLFFLSTFFSKGINGEGKILYYVSLLPTKKKGFPSIFYTYIKDRFPKFWSQKLNEIL